MDRERQYYEKVYAGRVDVFFEPPFFQIIHLDRYYWASEHLPNGALILDLGCGTGYGAPIIRKKTSAMLILADASLEALKYGKKFYPINNCERIVCDASHLPFRTEVFDHILMLEVIEHLSDPEQSLSEVNRVLKDGILIITTPNTDCLANRIYRFFGRPIRKFSDYHVKEFGYGELRKTLEHSGFRIIEEMGAVTLFPGNV